MHAPIHSLQFAVCFGNSNCGSLACLCCPLPEPVNVILKLVEGQSSIANGHHPGSNQTVPTVLQFARLVNMCRPCNGAFTLLAANLLIFLPNCRQLGTEKS